MWWLVAGCIEFGIFSDGKSDGEDTSPPPDPPEELCNGLDDDGDGGVDEGFPDADHNGRVDCLDETCEVEVAGAAQGAPDPACELVSPVADAWTLAELWSFAAPAAAPGAIYAVGQPAFAGGVVYAVLHDEAGAGWLVAVDGATGLERWSVAGFDGLAGVAAGEVDGQPGREILSFAADGTVLALDEAGALRWQSAAAAPAAEEGWQLLLTDLDGDGVVEVVADVLVLDGRDGHLLATLPVDTTTHGHRCPAVGDTDRDGTEEIYMAGRAFAPSGEELWYSGEGVEDTVWSLLLQLDGDPEGEVMTLGANLVLSDTDGTTLLRSPTFARNASSGPCVGDFDGDGATEFVYAGYDGLYERDLDLRNVWEADVQMFTGTAACVGYDLDGDGALEVVIKDELALQIFSGRTGEVLARVEHPSRVVFASPLVADLDGDGDVELVEVSTDGKPLRAWTHDGEGWPAVTPDWPVFDYDTRNVDAAGVVSLARPWERVNGVRGVPTNAHMAPAPDLAVELSDACVADCTYGPSRVVVQVRNEGAAAVESASLEVRLDGALLHEEMLGPIPAGATLDGILIETAAVGVFTATVGGPAECDPDDDVATWDPGCG